MHRKGQPPKQAQDAQNSNNTSRACSTQKASTTASSERPAIHNSADRFSWRVAWIQAIRGVINTLYQKKRSIHILCIYAILCISGKLTVNKRAAILLANCAPNSQRMYNTACNWRNNDDMAFLNEHDRIIIMISSPVLRITHWVVLKHASKNTWVVNELVNAIMQTSDQHQTECPTATGAARTAIAM